MPHSTLLYFLIIFFCCFSSPAISQKNDNKIYEATGTALVNRYLKLGEKYQSSQPDSATVCYEKARALAVQINDREGLSNYISDDIKLLNHEAKFEQALQLAWQHIHIARELHDSEIVINAYNEVANEEEYLGDFQLATTYYLQALKLAVQMDNKRLQGLISNNLSSVFISFKDYGKGYAYSANAFNLAKMQHDTTMMGDCLINMGVAEIHQRKYKEALLHFDEAEKIGYKEPDMTMVADALSDKGLVYYSMHNLQASEREYQKQETIAKKYGLPLEKLYALFQLAVVKKDKGDFSKAEQYATRAISIGERLNTNEELMEMYDTMAVIKLKMGKEVEAISYKNKFEAMKDTLMNAEVQTNIHRLELQYRSVQKDKEIAQQALKIERSNSALQRKNTLIAVILTGLVALIAILILSYRGYRHKQKLNQQQLLTLQKEHQVNTVKAKMQAREDERIRIASEMHDDIGSALTTILYLGEELKKKSQHASMQTVKCITDIATSVMDKMNEIIWSMNSEYDTMDDLVAYTRHHAVEFLQNHNLRYHFDLPDPIPSIQLQGEQRRNIYLVVKEALHNIVKHACATEVCISFRLKDSLSITIHDNGKGINLHTDNSSRFGNGLKNMRQRMEYIGGSLMITNNGGTTLQLNCPLHQSITDDLSI